jgi:hypothetical protein
VIYRKFLAADDRKVEGERRIIDHAAVTLR